MLLKILSYFFELQFASSRYEYLLGYESGFDVGDLSEDAPDDLVGLDASAAHVASLLSTEPSDSRFSPFFPSIYYHYDCFVSIITIFSSAIDCWRKTLFSEQ